MLSVRKGASFLVVQRAIEPHHRDGPNQPAVVEASRCYDARLPYFTVTRFVGGAVV